MNSLYIKTGALVAAVVLVVVVLGVLQSGDTKHSPSSNSPESSTREIPVPGKVTMVDLGADECKPCKMMAPILEEIKKAYAGRAEIIFIDVWKNKKEAQKYGVQIIPTQIFFTANGEEVERHTGFMDKNTIIQKLADLGIEPPKKYQDS